MHAKLISAVVAPLAAASLAAARPPAASNPGPDARAAVEYAAARGVTAAVAVLDTRDGSLWLAGEHDETFSSASVVKVMIAARLLVSGRMHGSTARLAHKMITRSDDAAADALYGLTGGDRLIEWVKAHYDVPSLGSPPTPPGRWGNTRITARGLVTLYQKLKADPKVAPWLISAMRQARPHGSDGQFQFFGIPHAVTDFAVKQGWTCCDGGAATFNSTGYVARERYAVALLAAGPPHTYGTHLMRTLNGMARALFPGGRIATPPQRTTEPSPAPRPPCDLDAGPSPR